MRLSIVGASGKTGTQLIDLALARATRSPFSLSK
jgi:hypothetical protein